MIWSKAPEQLKLFCKHPFILWTTRPRVHRGLEPIPAATPRTGCSSVTQHSRSHTRLGDLEIPPDPTVTPIRQRDDVEGEFSVHVYHLISLCSCGLGVRTKSWTCSCYNTFLIFSSHDTLCVLLMQHLRNIWTEHYTWLITFTWTSSIIIISD